MPEFITRRLILRGLASLPLIGGGVTLIGQPTASAEPVTRELLENYNMWLWGEHQQIAKEIETRYGAHDVRFRHITNQGARFYCGPDYNWTGNPVPASSRAAIVLSAVGCDWKA